MWWPKKRRHTVKLYAHHRSFQEISVERDVLPFFEYLKLGAAWVKDIAVRYAIPVAALLLRTVFFVCYRVGFFLLMLYQRLMKRGAVQPTTTIFKVRTGVTIASKDVARELPKQERRVFELLHHPYAFTLGIFALFLCSSLVFFRGAVLVTHGLETKTQVLGAADAGIKDLQEAQGLIKQQNPELAQQKFSQALLNFQKSQQELEDAGVVLNGILSVLPQKRSGDHLLEAVALISKAGVAFSAIAQRVQGIKITAQGLDGANPAALLREAQRGIGDAKKLLDQSVVLMRDVDISIIPKSQQAQFLKAKDKLTLLQRSTSTLDSVFSLLSSLTLGKKNLLVLFQNNNELRATGGFIGTYGAFTINNGTIEKTHVSSVYDLDGQLKEQIAPPHPLRVLNGQWFLRDSNWFFDFRQSAEVVSSFYEKEGGETPDIIMAMTPQIITDLLDVTGPISMTKYGVVLTTDNFVEETQIATSITYDKAENKPKQMLADFMPVLLQKLSSLPDTQKVLLAETLQRNLAAKHIMMYARDPGAELLIRQFNWGGTVADSDRDYLAVVSSNVGGTKTDLAMDQTIVLTSEIDARGAITNTLTITRSNSLPENNGLANTNFMRIFVPEGSQLLKAVGFSEKPVPRLDAEALKNYPDVLEWENAISKNVLSGMITGKEAGKTFFGNWLTVAGGETKTVTLTYQLPFKLNDTDHHSIFLQKQGGSLVQDFLYTIKFPDHTLAWDNGRANKRSEHELSYKTSIVKDELFGQVFQKVK